MGKYSSSNIDNHKKGESAEGFDDNSFAWKQEGTYSCKLQTIKCDKSFKKQTPGMMLEFKIRDADHLDDDLMEEAEGKILNVNYWHSAGKRMLVFVDVMIALGFDFGRIDQFEKDKGRDWKEKDWQSQKVFREVEDAGPIMDIIVAYQRDDDDNIKTDDKGNPYWDIDIDLDSIKAIDAWKKKKKKSTKKADDDDENDDDPV